MTAGAPAVHACKHHPHPTSAGAPGPHAARPTGGAPSDYVCPMHPEVVRKAPASCPICGMALERRVASAGDAPAPELADMRRRLLASVALSIPLLVVSMGGLVFGHAIEHLFSASTKAYVELALSAPVCLVVAWPFHRTALTSLRLGKLNMFSLVSVGVLASFAFSLVFTLFPHSAPAGLRDPMGGVPLYYESASVIVALVALGQWLELRARESTGSAMRALVELAPKTARRIRADGTDDDVSIDTVVVGDSLRIRPGERVPVDGHVTEGTSLVDESMVTGEPLAIAKTKDDRLVAGTVNQSGALVMRAEGVGDETLLARIVALVGEAQRSRAPVQRLADSIASWFVPAVIVVAVLTFAGWAAFGPEPRLVHALVNAVAVLIIACPCALGLATPMSIMVAAGKGATFGVLFRNAETIERFARVDTLVVDKTGTVTEGKPRVVSLVTFPGFDESALLRFAASIERSSEHPIGASIVAEALERGLALGSVDRFVGLSGKGVQGRTDGKDVAVGEASIDAAAFAAGGAELETRADELRARGETVAYVAVDGKPAGLIGVRDPLKPTSKSAIAALRQSGLRILMLSGDRREPAEATAREVGISEVIAGVLPDEKARVVERLKREGHRVAMAGDGVNDAPALAVADVGIAMGAGSGVAIETAGITLVDGNLQGLVRARELSRLTMRNIRQNLLFAFLYNGLGIPIAAGALYPVFGWLLSPMLAAAAMSLSSVSVVANALRLSRARFKRSDRIGRTSKTRKRPPPL